MDLGWEKDIAKGANIAKVHNVAKIVRENLSAIFGIQCNLFFFPTQLRKTVSTGVETKIDF